MLARNLMAMVIRYWSTGDSKLLDEIIRSTSRLVPSALPPALREDPDLVMALNRRLADHWRAAGGPSSANSEDLRRLIGRTALQVIEDGMRQSRRWRGIGRFFRLGRIGRSASLRQTEWVGEVLDWIGGQLTEQVQIRVFELMRQGLNSRQISEAIGGGCSEQRIWIIKAKIRALIAEKIQDEFQRAC